MGILDMRRHRRNPHIRGWDGISGSVLRWPAFLIGSLILNILLLESMSWAVHFALYTHKSNKMDRDVLYVRLAEHVRRPRYSTGHHAKSLAGPESVTVAVNQSEQGTAAYPANPPASRPDGAGGPGAGEASLGVDGFMDAGNTGDGYGGPGLTAASEPVKPPPPTDAKAPATAAAATAYKAPLIEITSPRDGDVIDCIKDRSVMVEGKVEGAGVNMVRLHFNKATTDLPVEHGTFKVKQYIEEEYNLLFAECVGKQGGGVKSDEVRFKAINHFPKDLVVRVGYNIKDTHPRLRCRWSAHPLAKKDGSPPAPPEFKIVELSDSILAYVRNAVPGIYTVGFEYSLVGPSEATFEVEMFGSESARKKTRTVGPVKLEGIGYLPAVRVLLPECVFWEDNSWFSGIIEDGRSTTKYKQPEGIIWKEDE